MLFYITPIIQVLKQLDVLLKVCVLNKGKYSVRELDLLLQ